MDNLTLPSTHIEKTTSYSSLTGTFPSSGSNFVEYDIGQPSDGLQHDVVHDATAKASEALETPPATQGDIEAIDHYSATDAETNAALSHVASDNESAEDELEDDEIEENEVEQEEVERGNTVMEEQAEIEVSDGEDALPKFPIQPFVGFRPRQVEPSRGKFDFDSESPDEDDDDGVEEENDIVPYELGEEEEGEVEQNEQQDDAFVDAPASNVGKLPTQPQPVVTLASNLTSLISLQNPIFEPPVSQSLAYQPQQGSTGIAPDAPANTDAGDIDIEDIDDLFGEDADDETAQVAAPDAIDLVKTGAGPHNPKGKGKIVSFAIDEPVRKKSATHGFIFRPDYLSDDDSLFVSQDSELASHLGGLKRISASSGLLASCRRKPSVDVSDLEDEELLSNDDLEQINIDRCHEYILGDGSRSVEDMFAMTDEEPATQQLLPKSGAKNGGHHSKPPDAAALARMRAEKERLKSGIVRERGVPRLEKVVKLMPGTGGLRMPSLFPMPKVSGSNPPGATTAPSISSQSAGNQRPRSLKDAQETIVKKLLEKKSGGRKAPPQNATSVQLAKTSALPSTVLGDDHSWMEEEAEEEIDLAVHLQAEMRDLETKMTNCGKLSNHEIARLCSLRGNLRKLETTRKRIGGWSEGTSAKRLAPEDDEDDEEEAVAAKERSNYHRQQEAELRVEALRKSLAQPSSDVSVNKLTHGKTARERHDILAEREAEKSAGAISDSTSAIVKPGKKIIRSRLMNKWSQEHKVIQRMFRDLLNSDLIQQRAEQGDVEAAPVIETNIKARQLNNLHRTIPADHNVRMAKIERAQLLEASKSFGHGKVKARDGHWHMKGMREATFLRHHQLQAAAWMVGREVSNAKPHGGILADQMGLGKTIEAIACCIGNPPDKKDSTNRRTTLIVLPASLVGQWNKEIEKHVDLNLWGKIMVYKKSAKMSIRALREMNFILTTYAEVRNSWKIEDVNVLTEEDIANQSTLGKDKWLALNRDRCGALHQIEWYRIILDEAHEIKNWRSAGATACYNLQAKYRFALSGTPIQNDANELFSYLHFLQEPYSDTFANFKSRFGDPKSADAQQRLSVLMHLYMYRRTFADRILGRPLIILPEIKTELRFVELSREEIVIYRVVEEVYRNQINPLLSDKTKGSYALMLSKLLRLRQAASHPFLLESVFRETFTPDDLGFLEEKFKKYEATTLPVYRQIKQWLAPNGEEETAQPFGKGVHGTDFKMGPFLKNLKPAWAVEKNCQICQDITMDTQVLDCGHHFCECCIEENFQSQISDDGRYYCPKCNNQVGMYRPYVDPNATDSHEQPEGRKQNFAAWKPHVRESQWLELCTKGKAKLVPSAKTIVLKAQMLKWFNEAPNDKILVFTQFRVMARIIGLICEEEKWGHVYLMGEMSWKNREYAVKAFHDKKEIKVMVAILKCGGVGLNLTCANRCINVDPWWNHSVEQQAIGRIFRYGQPKACRVMRLIAKNTVDHRMLDLQKEKIEAIDIAMQTGKAAERLTVEEIASLFGRITHDEKGVLQVESDYDVSDEIVAPASAPSMITPPPGQKEESARPRRSRRKGGRSVRIAA